MKFGSRELDLSRPKIMGILNVTPDSFYDGGRFIGRFIGRVGGHLDHPEDTTAVDLDACLRAAEQMLADGAHILDIGGESTRPNASPVSSQQEQDRVLPVLEKITACLDVVVSLDTSNPEVISQGAALGAGLINDVRALTREGALAAAAQTQLPVCLMHMQGRPETMQREPKYQSVVTEVFEFLEQRAQACERAGIAADQIIFDPGIGFGKTLEHNKALLLATDQLRKKGKPVLVGVSRKSMIGQILNDQDPNNRLYGSLALAFDQFSRGASILRVHDVKASADMLNVFEFLQK